MRIAILTSGNRGIGSYCMNLYNYLKKKGHKLLFVSEVPWIKTPIPDLYQAKSVMVLGLAPLVYKPGGIIKAVEDFKPDIIHYHWPSGTMDFLFRKVRRFDVPILVTLHVAVGSHKALFDKMWYMHFWAFKHHLKKVESVNSISVFVQNQVKRLIKLPKSKHELIYAGVNSETFSPKHRKESRSKKIRLLFVGQVMPEKGIDVLARAVRRVAKKKDVVLNVIGDGHLLEKLKQETKGDKSINWVGFLRDQKAISEYYANADLTVLPTRWDEAFSLVPVESLASGTPVCATNKGGTPELIFPKKTGFLLKACDEDEIVNILMKTDKKELESMRKHCRDLVLKRHTLEKMGDGHLELYERMIKDYNKKHSKDDKGKG